MPSKIPTDPILKKKYLARKAEIKRNNYYKNLEVSRAKSRERKRKQRDERREEINRKQREYYAANRAANAAKANTRRIHAHPYRGLTKAIRSCGNEPHELDQLVGLLRERLTRCDGIRRAAEGLRPHDRRIYRSELKTDRKKRM